MNGFRLLFVPVAWWLIILPVGCSHRQDSGQPVNPSGQPGSAARSTTTSNAPSANAQQAMDFPEASLTPGHLAAAKDLQGMWTVVSFHHDGGSTPVQEGRVIPYTFEGNKLITVGPFDAKVEIEYRLDPSKNPKQIDQRFTGGALGPWIAKGIYKIEGETLTICYGGPNVARPTDFTTKPGDGRTMRVHKRVK
jgi:uncharacterized protein (TIGR03067 family)